MLRFFLTFIVGTLTVQARGKVTIAAAANLVHTIDVVEAAFRTQHPEIEIVVVIASSGSLVAQITHGAPFDVFLSADLDYPQALIKSGHAVADSLTPFAVGQLVLWTTNPDLPIDKLVHALRDPAMHKLAIAHPSTAPYGRAAQQTLESLHLWQALQPKLVIGENISQAAQFVGSGNADAGFIARSLVMSPTLAGQGRWIEVHADLHQPLTQGAVLTLRGADNPSAREFLIFLLSEETRKVFARQGYGVPISPP